MSTINSPVSLLLSGTCVLWSVWWDGMGDGGGLECGVGDVGEWVWE